METAQWKLLGTERDKLPLPLPLPLLLLLLLLLLLRGPVVVLRGATARTGTRTASERMMLGG